jgi:hypothetical protein
MDAKPDAIVGNARNYMIMTSLQISPVNAARSSSLQPMLARFIESARCTTNSSSRSGKICFSSALLIDEELMHDVKLTLCAN